MKELYIGEPDFPSKQLKTQKKSNKIKSLLENVRYSIQDSNLSITSNKTGVDNRIISSVNSAAHTIDDVNRSP